MSYSALPQSESSLELRQWRETPRRPPPSPSPSRFKLPPALLHRFGKVGATTAFFGTAALSGCLLYLLLLFFFSGPPAHDPNAKYTPALLPDGRPWEDAAAIATATDPTATAVHVPPESILAPPHQVDYAAPTSPVYNASAPVAPPLDYHELSLEGLRDHVAQTNGYFVRDWSLALGWNNVSAFPLCRVPPPVAEACAVQVRYIIEASFVHAQLLNRTLVLPSFVYARACEYGLDACAEYAEMVNKGDALHTDEWRTLPYEKQMGFRVPIQLMLNLTRMRELHPVLLVSDYLRLHALPPALEASDGRWQREAYHASPPVYPLGPAQDADALPTLFVAENHHYDPRGSTRVDRIPDDMKRRGAWSPDGGDPARGERGHWTEGPRTMTAKKLYRALDENSVTLEWERAREVVRAAGSGEHDLDTDEGVERALRANGWGTVYTFNAVLNMEFTKTVVDPIRQAVPRVSVRGWVDDYGDVRADVLLLAGETHLYRKEGGVRFTAPEARTAFQDMVLHHIVPVDAVFALAAGLARRMRARVDGRLWMGAHMRRGDFVRAGWVMEQDPLDHVNRVKERLTKGRKILEDLKDIEAYPVPGVQPNPEQLALAPPLPSDPFYVATDERDPDALATIAAHGAIYLSDLLTMADRRAFGWPLMLTDVRALLEQALLAHSAYFYAHAMSSVAGGIVNMRAAHGADPRTLLID
ncbi:hypothetical protein OF83DRAFT_1285805 [Amylostereum chailletii]|nr:hypothetical protein OF83DRAFT_1285805 [Amylostereum chailletii]